MVTLQDLEKKRSLRETRLRAALKSLIDTLKSLGARRVFLFGSLARGEVTEWSDLDLLVVMPSTKPGRAWRKTVLESVKREVACDILVFTENELDEDLPASSFLRQIIQEGVVVYESKS